MWAMHGRAQQHSLQSSCGRAQQEESGRLTDRLMHRTNYRPVSICRLESLRGRCRSGPKYPRLRCLRNRRMNFDRSTAVLWRKSSITGRQPMNRILIAIAFAVLTVGPARASEKDDIVTVLKLWISGEAGAVATCDDDAAVIDDFPPFEWHGLGACSRWRKDQDTDSRKEGITDAAGRIGNPQQLMISGNRAYAVLPATWTFTKKGKRVSESATATFVLIKSAAGWRITAWTWATRTVQ